MFVIGNKGYALICDGPDCTARTDASRVRESGWILASLLGPHLCPDDVTVRFAHLMMRTFTEPPD